MGLNITLRRVQKDLAHDYLYTACKRLHGLINAYPNKTELRSMQAEIYWKRRRPQAAGKFWYLEESQTDDVRQAIAAFEQACGRDPWAIWKAIGFRGHPDYVESPYARDRLELLREACEKKTGGKPAYVNAPQRPDGKPLPEQVPASMGDKLKGCGCVLLIVLSTGILVFAFFVGFHTMFHWLYR